ncbi:hypothetical protein MHF_0650 [Mycoplasma haemofelis Ohio2]|uniref:Uncharacterized protein n=1 Tax=Mycoplasma haemofelis (strain Ohio2) TaxID=859194 RepID=F6FI74_MYCHI|nr:hypothetical protein MHF_0650 [Mycoplasma haemofelis Ohio2]
MDLSYRLLSLLAFGTAAAAAGGYFLMGGEAKEDHKIKTIGGRLRESLMLASEGSSKWEARKDSLSKASDESLVDDLKDIKNNSPTYQKLRDWCIANAESPFEEGKRLLNVKAYCTYMVKDKLSKVARSENDYNWEYASLQLQLPNVILSSAMMKVKSKLDSDSPKGEALKVWCKEILDSMYENDSNFKDADSYCTND